MAQNLDYASDSSIVNTADSVLVTGRFYTWAGAMGFHDSCNYADCSRKLTKKHRGVCPLAWHVPSDSEFSVLLGKVESDPRVGVDRAGWALKSRIVWYIVGNGKDLFGFKVVPGYFYFQPSPSEYSGYANFWTTSLYNSANPWNIHFQNTNLHVVRVYNQRYYPFSIRCIQD